MFKIAVSALGMSIFLAVAHAQDIAGVEDCTKVAGLDKKTSCLQSNVNFLQQLVTRNARDAAQQLAAARNEIIALKSTVTGLHTALQQLQAQQKPASDKKPQLDSKPEAK